MKNQTYVAVAIFTMFLALAVSLHARPASRVEANIPFEFSAGSEKLPAGTYTIRRASANLLVLRNSDGKSIILNAPMSLESKDKGERLVFSKQAGEYVLTQVWLNGETGRQLTSHDKSDPVEITLHSR